MKVNNSYDPNEEIVATEELPQEDEQQNPMVEEEAPVDIKIREILDSFNTPQENFNIDISSSLPEEVLNRISMYLEDRVKADIKHHESWLESVNQIKPYLGFSLNKIFNKNASDNVVSNSVAGKVFDNTFSTALLRLWAMLRAELLPAEGPVGFKTVLDDSETSDILGGVVQDALNEYLTTEDKGFYPDYDRFLLFLLFYGCIFRKIFIHPTTGKPVSRFVLPEDLIVENNHSSFFESKRITHIRYLSKGEILRNINLGIFRMTAELNYLKNDLNIQNSGETVGANYNFSDDTEGDKKVDNLSDSFKFYETYEYLCIEDFLNKEDINAGDSAPYIITRCVTSNKIMSLIPNWDKEDPEKKKSEHFIHYNLFPGFDVYGLGLAKLLGSNAITLTEIQRLCIDAAVFQNFPGGLRSPGVKNQDNNISIKPGQFVEIDTGNLPLAQAVMPLPYQGPSPALMELAERIRGATGELASTTEVGISQESANTPVGTTMAALEVANRMQSTILKTIHKSFSEEIELIFNNFYAKERFTDNFSGFNVIPISDPSVESTTMRIMKAENLLKIAGSAPELHNMRAIYERMYAALGIENIDELLVPKEQEGEQQEPPMDPQLQVQMADTEQRRLEVESRERIAMLQMEGAGYKTQMELELDTQKLELDRYMADLKSKEAQELSKVKLELELLKLETNKAEEDERNLSRQREETNKTEIELLKMEKDDRIKSLEQMIEQLKLALQESQRVELLPTINTSE